jgi:HEPN domain-containing protein
LLNNANAPARHACWHAQQAAEKAIKAALIFAVNDYPRIHDLDTLRNLLPADWQLKQTHPKLRSLTEWAVEARYPGPWPAASKDEAERCVQLAKEVLESVISDLRARGVPV